MTDKKDDNHSNYMIESKNYQVFVTQQADNSEIIAEVIYETEHTFYVRFPFNVVTMMDCSWNAKDGYWVLYKKNLVGQYTPDDSMVKLYEACYSEGPPLKKLFDKLIDAYLVRLNEAKQKRKEKSKDNIEADDELQNTIVNIKDFFKNKK